MPSCNPFKLTNALLPVMKIRFPQAIARTLTAAAVFVSPPLAVTVATGSFFAGTAFADITVTKTGGDFVLRRNENGNFVEQSANGDYGEKGYIIGENGSITFKGDVLDALQKKKEFKVTINVPDPENSVNETPIVTLGDKGPNFSLEVDVTTKKGKPVITRYLYANPIVGDEYGTMNFNSTDPQLKVSWDDGNLSGKIDSSTISCAASGLSGMDTIILNSDYVSTFTINIDQVNTVNYGNNLSKTYGSGTVVLENKLGEVDAIALETAGEYVVQNSSNQKAVKEADVFIGGGAQLKIISDGNAESTANVAGNKAIYIDSSADSAALFLSSTSDSLAGVHLGNVTLVGETSMIKLSGGGDGRIVLLGSIAEEQKESVDNGRKLIITNDANGGSGLTVGDSGPMKGSINVGTLELQSTSVYLDGTGSVTAGTVTVTKGTEKGVLTNVVMGTLGIEAYGTDRGKVSEANVTVSGTTVKNLDIDNSTITLSAKGSTLTNTTITASTVKSEEISTIQGSDGQHVSIEDSVITLGNQSTVMYADITNLKDGSTFGTEATVSHVKFTQSELDVNAKVISDVQVLGASKLTLTKDSAAQVGVTEINGSTVIANGKAEISDVKILNASKLTLEGAESSLLNATINNSTVTLSGADAAVTNGTVGDGATVSLLGEGSRISGTTIDSNSKVTLSGAKAVVTGVTVAGGATVSLSGEGSRISGASVTGSTITLGGTGSVLGGAAASGEDAGGAATYATRDSAGSSPTVVDRSTINLGTGASIEQGTKVSNSTINVEAEAEDVTISGELQNDLIELKNACSLKVTDAVLGAGTKFGIAEGETVTTNPTVELSKTTVMLAQADLDLTSTKVLTDQHGGVEIFSDKLANVTSASEITLGFTRDLIEYLEKQLNGRVHYVKINFTGMNLGEDHPAGWVTALTGEIPTDGTVEFNSGVASDGSLVTGVVTLGPSVTSIPEPASGALSVLALAAIAARRRRRKAGF